MIVHDRFLGKGKVENLHFEEIKKIKCMKRNNNS